MNPFDELSVEESVRIREKKSAPGGVEDICVISAGPPKAQDVLRTAMAMGADRAIHVDVKEGEDLEPLTVAKLLQKAVEAEKSNLVILGKQSIDDDANQTGQMLAGLLGWPQATQASSVQFGEGDSVSVVKEVDGGVETVRAKLPMVVTTDLRLNEPRYASLPNIMKAKKKKLDKKTLADFGITNERRLKVLKVTGTLTPRGLAVLVRERHVLTKSCRARTEAGWRQGRGCERPRGEAQGAGRHLKATPPRGQAMYKTRIRENPLNHKAQHIRIEAVTVDKVLIVHTYEARSLHRSFWIPPCDFCPLSPSTNAEDEACSLVLKIMCELPDCVPGLCILISVSIVF